MYVASVKWEWNISENGAEDTEVVEWTILMTIVPEGQEELILEKWLDIIWNIWAALELLLGKSTNKADREEMGYANMCTLCTNMSDGRTNNRCFKNVLLQLQQFKKNENNSWNPQWQVT